MLKELLAEIKDADYISKSNISKKLKISEELVGDGFEQLARMGYIKEESSSASCDIGCSGCAYANSCNQLPIKTFMITEKGQRLLAK